jgi:hypothetical protein
MTKRAAPFLAITLAATLATSAAAAETAGPLAPGKPAGVQQAQIYGNTVLYLAIGAGFIAGLVLLANDQKTTTTTSTNP